MDRATLAGRFPQQLVEVTGRGFVPCASGQSAQLIPFLLDSRLGLLIPFTFLAVDRSCHTCINGHGAEWLPVAVQ